MPALARCRHADHEVALSRLTPSLANRIPVSHRQDFKGTGADTEQPGHYPRDVHQADPSGTLVTSYETTLPRIRLG